MSTRQVLLERGTTALATAGVPDPPRDARVLMRWASGLDGPSLIANLAERPGDDEAERYLQAIARRARRVPVSHITGTRLFWGREFIVTPDVLDPRPETESLIEIALREPADRLLDLGVGSGCILVSLLAEWPGAVGQGVDLSGDAIRIARLNAGRAGVDGRATFSMGSWFGPVSGRFGLIVSNPPYLTEDELVSATDELCHEPAVALSPGGDGLDAYRMIIDGASEHLTSDGRLILEIGSTQAEAVVNLLQRAGFDRIAVDPDLDGRDRIISARLTGKS
ncbi:MAG: peptide chain release factor N(5)-glutamine methyltransferase [Pseudomonadota bacterium]